VRSQLPFASVSSPRKPWPYCITAILPGAVRAMRGTCTRNFTSSKPSVVGRPCASRRRRRGCAAPTIGRTKLGTFATASMIFAIGPSGPPGSVTTFVTVYSGP
jgi:hypothetical protein